MHKTYNFNDAEIEGFRAAVQEVHNAQVDLITVMERTNFRLLRENAYPSLRGTQRSFSNKSHLLFTRGAVPYFETDAGMYIPAPIEIRLCHYDESPNVICDEILSLTKMNWNNTQFDRKYPITIECARNVGVILKSLEPGTRWSLNTLFICDALLCVSLRSNLFVPTGRKKKTATCKVFCSSTHLVYK